MTSAKAILVCDETLADEISANITADAACVSDSFCALEELSTNPFDMLITTSLQNDLASFCKASRRINPAIKICVISSVADEPDVVKLKPAVIDSYLIYPAPATRLAALTE